MQVYAIRDVLSADYYQTKFDSNSVEQLLFHLTPEKMKVKVISKEYHGKTDRTEKWYGTEYKKMALKKSILDNLRECGLNKAFRLPEKNLFIPDDLTLVSHNNRKHSKEPRLIYSNELCRLFYKEDLRFFLPKAFIKLEIRLK